MAGGVNKVILVGNLGADPEVRTFPSGDKYCNLRVATTESWRDRNTGERRDRTEWHRVTIYNKVLADVAERFLSKGKQVYLEGQLETRKWQDQSGQDRYSTEVALRPFNSSLVLLGQRGDSDDTPSGGYGRSNDRPPERNFDSQVDTAGIELDDDTPF